MPSYLNIELTWSAAADGHRGMGACSTHIARGWVYQKQQLARLLGELRDTPRFQVPWPDNYVQFVPLQLWDEYLRRAKRFAEENHKQQDAILYLCEKIVQQRALTEARRDRRKRRYWKLSENSMSALALDGQSRTCWLTAYGPIIELSLNQNSVSDFSRWLVAQELEGK